VIYLFSLVALGLVLLYAGLLGMLWMLQERVVFQPPGDVPPSAVAARRVVYQSSDGVSLFAFVVGECTPDARLVLAFHGNADLARWFIPWASTLVEETGACVVIPEYRGYDRAPGSPTYAASALDARAALQFVSESLHVRPDRLVLYGHSLGSAIASELTTVVTPASLVLQSPFTTARAMAARMFLPGLTMFWRLISRVHFDTVNRVRSLTVPVFVAHGDRDLIIPVRMGREVFAAAAVKGELLIVPGAGHNDVPELGGRAYWDWLRHAVEASRTVNHAARAERRSEP
jgi:fermentation-respiration switch protein FrsA (DUF1100 family)